MQILLLVLLAQVPSPVEVIGQALTDVRSLAPEQRPHVRYLSLYSIPAPDRERWQKLLAFHCNSLSRESDLISPVVIPHTQGGLLRIDLRDYDWSRETWESLATSDPYFHATIQSQQPDVVKPWPGGVWADDGKHYAPGAFNYKVKAETVRKLALAPWLGDAKAVGELVNLTQSQTPVVRGDWFLWQTAVQSERKPGYYDFLGIRDKKGFDALVGYDEKLQRSSKRVELLEAVADSMVTLQPRRLGAFPAISGWYWQTFDSRKASDEHNPLRILNGGLKFDAQEVFGHGPNGLLVWGLFDDKGARQDAAPDFIASDSTAHGTDRRVHAGLSCLRCHLPAAGINPVDGWARGLFQGNIRLQSPDYAKLKELRQKYLRDLDGAIEDSRRVYTRAIAATAGMKPAELGVVYGEAFARYDGPVDLTRAAADVGLAPAALKTALEQYVKQTGGLDFVLTALMVGKRVRPDQYHEVFATLATIAKGYVP